MTFRSIAAIAAAVVILTTGCSATAPQPTPPTPSTTTSVAVEVPTPDALKQLETLKLEKNDYRHITSDSRSGHNTQIWGYGDDIRIMISDQFTSGKGYEATRIDTRRVNEKGRFTIWCGPTQPRNVFASMKAFEEAVRLLTTEKVEMTPNSRGYLTAALPSPHECWVQYI